MISWRKAKQDRLLPLVFHSYFTIKYSDGLPELEISKKQVSSTTSSTADNNYHPSPNTSIYSILNTFISNKLVNLIKQLNWVFPAMNLLLSTAGGNSHRFESGICRKISKQKVKR